MSTRRGSLRTASGVGGGMALGALPASDLAGGPAVNVNYCALSKDGQWGGAGTWAGARFAVSVHGDSRPGESAFLFERS